MSEKKYDVTVYGATGFVGKLIIQHLLSHPQFTSGEFTWAIAGRSASKLQSLKDSYQLPSSVGIIEADNLHVSKLSSLARQSHVVLNLVGPYSAYGSFSLAEQCVEHGTHYTDLSGESLYNQRLVKELHEKAKSKGVVLAASVGYDSLPPDLNTLLAVRALRRKAQKEGIDIKHLQGLSGHFVMGGASGGTVASLRHMASTAPWQIAAQQPNAMGSQLQQARATSLQFKLHDPATWFLPHFGKYGFRSPFALHNTRTVYHSASLVDVEDSSSASSGPLYGKTFQYLDLMTGGTPTSRTPAIFTLVIGTFVSLVMKNIFTLMRTSALFRRFTEKYIPVGTGPSPASQRKGFAVVDTLVSGFDTVPTANSRSSKATPKIATAATWTAKNADPGYLMTSRVISEVSLLLAFKAKQQKGKVSPAGVRTGATIDPDALVERLTKYANIQIDVRDAPLFEQDFLPIGAS